MALTSTLITNSILAAAPELQGFVWKQLAAAIGVGVVSWVRVPTNLSLLGATSGVVGSGQVLGKVFVSPAPLPVNLSTAGHSLLGPNAGQVARAVGVGVATAFNASAQYRGVSVGVGVGSDTSRVLLSNGVSLTTFLVSSAAAMGIQGPNMQVLASALGNGIAALLLTGTGLGAVTGAGGPSAAIGTSKSSVF